MRSTSVDPEPPKPPRYTTLTHGICTGSWPRRGLRRRAKEHPQYAVRPPEVLRTGSGCGAVPPGKAVRTHRDQLVELGREPRPGRVTDPGRHDGRACEGEWVRARSSRSWNSSIVATARTTPACPTIAANRCWWPSTCSPRPGSRGTQQRHVPRLTSVHDRAGAAVDRSRAVGLGEEQG